MSESGNRVMRAMKRITETPGPWELAARVGHDGSLCWAIVSGLTGQAPHIVAGIGSEALRRNGACRPVGCRKAGLRWRAGRHHREAVGEHRGATPAATEAADGRARAHGAGHAQDGILPDGKPLRLGFQALPHIEDGWVQIDTTKDASYYGTWAHRGERKIINFCDGDLYTTTCADDEAFAAEIAEFARWAKQAGYWEGIDAHRLVGEWYDAGLRRVPARLRPRAA